MKTVGTIVPHSGSNDKPEALKFIMKALKIKFEEISDDKSPYDPDFVKMISKGDKDLKEGRGKEMTLNELDKLWK